MQTMRETATPGRGKDLLGCRPNTSDEATSCGGGIHKFKGSESCVKDDSEVKPSFTEEVTIYIGDRVMEPRFDREGADSVANSQGDSKDSCNVTTNVSRFVDSEQQCACETIV